MPRSDIGSRSEKNSRRNPSGYTAANVTAIERIQPSRPRKIQPSKTRYPRRTWIVVVKLHDVSAVEIVLHGLFIRLRRVGQPSAPIPLQIPVCSSDAREVSLE